MKVIERKNFDNIFPMTVTCQRVEDAYGFAYGDKKDFCGSTLEVEAEDIKKHSWQKYPDYAGTDYGVICPVCHKFVVIDTKLIPDNILKSARETRVGN